MKSCGKTLILVLTVAILSLAARAQLGGDMPVQSAPPDSIVQVTAEAQGLATVAPDQLPRTGTFWLVLPGPRGGLFEPYPCPSLDFANLPIYSIADGQYLVDGTAGATVTTPASAAPGRLTSSSTALAALEAQATAVFNLITKIQTVTANRLLRTASRMLGMDGPEPGSGGGDGGGDTFTNYVSYTIDTNQLWLEITNIASGWTHLNLHSGTNAFTPGQVYAIWTTTDLLTGWQVEAEVWPAADQPGVVPFTLPTQDRQNLYVRAQDWTGVDSNSDGVPDWWLWKYFGTTDLSCTNLDSTGTQTLGQDFTNRTDPNMIQFTAHFGYGYSATTAAAGTIDVTAGVPSQMALQVDTNDFTAAQWQPYSSSFTAALPAVEAQHGVWIGLKGRAADSTPTWIKCYVVLDQTPPAIMSLTPGDGTTGKPVIQIVGQSSENLRSVACTLTNAAGVWTNFTSYPSGLNGFKVLDVDLTNGVNQISVTIAD